MVQRAKYLSLCLIYCLGW